MSLSGYQVESFLNELRQIWGLRTHVPAYYEPSSISTEGKTWSQSIPKTKPNERWIAPNQIIEFIGDTTHYDPIIEWERQRRAGLFVNPIYVPKNPPPVFALVQETPSSNSQAEDSEHERVLPICTPSETIENHHIPIQTQAVIEKTEALQDIVEFEENFEIDEESAISEDQMEADVIDGNGRITEDATVRFFKHYPDSALKFLFNRELDGKALNQETLKIHARWKTRGLSKQKLYQHLCNIMNWEKIPKMNIAELFSQIQETMIDLSHAS